MSVGESQARIKMFVKKELAGKVDLNESTVDAIANAISKAISENNHELEKELNRLRRQIQN